MLIPVYEFVSIHSIFVFTLFSLCCSSGKTSAKPKATISNPHITRGGRGGQGRGKAVPKL